jgi:transmembrane sensor
MIDRSDDQVLARIAEQASAWFVANDENPLLAEESAAFVAWLKASPIHVEEFLAVAAIARDLHAYPADAALLDGLLARARAEDSSRVQPLWSKILTAVHGPRWRQAVLAGVAALLCAASVWLVWHPQHPVGGIQASSSAVELHAGHGQQRDYRLHDGTVIHLNTDSSVRIDARPAQLRIQLVSGEAAFDTVPTPGRIVSVAAGAARISDVGTRFNVRLTPSAAVVTVMEGEVAVTNAAPTLPAAGTESVAVLVHANQQLRVTAGQWPTTPVVVDAARVADWLSKQIEFDNEPLEQVASEFNRYATQHVEITDPALRNLKVSGAIATDEPQEFIAFLRSLEGVRVETQADVIRVSRR